MKRSAIFIHQVSSSASLTNYYEFVDFFCDFNQIKHKIICVVSNGGKIREEGKALFFECGNELREFTAWKKGFDEIGDDIFKHDLLIVSNETIFKHRNFDLAYKVAYAKIASLIKDVGYPVAAGDLDQIMAKPPYYLSFARNYLSTYLIVLNNPAVRILDRGFEFQDLISVLRSDKNAESVLVQDNNIIYGEYRDILEGWVYKKSRYKKWYGHKKLNNTNYSSLQSKLFSIIIEHSFSQRLVKRGCELVDVRLFIERGLIENIYNLMYRLNKSLVIRIKWLLNVYCA